MMESDKYTRRTKHTDIEFHTIKHLKEEGIIDIQYCSSKLMTPDILTKRVPEPEFQKHRMKLKLLPHPSSEVKGESEKVKLISFNPDERNENEIYRDLQLYYTYAKEFPHAQSRAPSFWTYTILWSSRENLTELFFFFR